MNRKIKLSFIVFLILSFVQTNLCGQTFDENEERTVTYSQPSNKGELYIHLSLPFINSFRMTPEDEGVKNITGLTGVTIGLDYFHSKNQFVHFEGSTAMSAQFRNAEYGRISSDYISLSNNHKIKRFSIGYGLSFAIENSWRYGEWKVFNPYAPLEIIEKSHSAFGLIFPTYFQVRKFFNIGIVYRPTFYRPTLSDKFAYEHLISVDFAWKIGGPIQKANNAIK